MSRTINEIYNEIIEEKETFSSLDDLDPQPDTAQTLLSDLTTASKVAIWRLTFYVVAFAIWTHEKLFDSFSADIEARALELIPGTIRWYRNQCLVFQHGYDLTWDGEKYVYTDTTSADAIASKIVTNAAAVESSGTVVIKVAKGDTGSLAPLTTAEKSAFAGYIEQIKFAGTITQIISESADLLWVAATIYYDPLVLDSTGILIADGSTKPVEDGIEEYIQGLPFDGNFLVMDMVDAIQASTGVVNVVISTCQGKYGSNPYTDILAITSQTYASRAGYMEIDPVYPLASTLTYVSD